MMSLNVTEKKRYNINAERYMPPGRYREEITVTSHILRLFPRTEQRHWEKWEKLNTQIIRKDQFKRRTFNRNANVEIFSFSVLNYLKLFSFPQLCRTSFSKGEWD